ncbi:MAG: hypothetical protein H8E70_03490 [Candidatus Marinimicrobia bacterium]|nr:hypothetical protein [Candidatus Neomarinimicrobiota bacterium]
MKKIIFAEVPNFRKGENVMKKYIILSFLLSNLIFSQNVIEIETATIEFIGLEKWTIEMVSDSMKKYADGAELNQIYCNSVLDDVGFPSATATSDFKDGKMLVMVSLVEHQYSDLIQFTDSPKDTLPLNEEWNWINEYSQKHPMGFQLALAAYGDYLNRDFESIMDFMDEFSETLKKFGMEIDTTHFGEFWSGLEKHNKKSDFKKAKQIILNDANYQNRLPAICVLANFNHNPEAYDLLFHLLRGRDVYISDFAGKILKTINKYPVSNLNLFDHEEHLIPLLNGTNIEHFLNVMDFLMNDIYRTRKETKFIIQHSERLLTHYLKSDYFENETVEILKKLYGEDFENRDEWLAYLQKQ